MELFETVCLTTAINYNCGETAIVIPAGTRGAIVEIFDNGIVLIEIDYIQDVVEAQPWQIIRA